MTETGIADGWGGDEAQHWVAEADRYDGQLAPFGELLFDRLRLAASDNVLDVGCGCRATIQVAKMSAANVGVDVSEEMLAVGRLRAEVAGVANVELVTGDAARHQFAAEAFDAIVSRFGVMFFDDPVAAFTNLHQALRVGGRLTFVCWQGMEANPWQLIPGVAAAAHVPLPPMTGAERPEMFSLADRDHLTTLLSTAGYNDIEIEPVGPTITLGGGGSLEETVRSIAECAERGARQR
jgi:SAM-dependent methyltransferase